MRALRESMARASLQWPDGRTRCRWANPSNPVYIAYHDEEWGIPVHDDRVLYEMLVLECFQAGLSWECILNKRDAFRAAYNGFDPEKVAAYTDDDVERLMSDPGIVRNREKIAASISNTRVFLDIAEERGTFSDYLWGWTGGEAVHETGRTSSPLSDAVSKDLKRRGMRFVGTVTVYSYLQAVGVIDSHEPGCFLFGAGARRGSRRSSSGSRSSARRSRSISPSRPRLHPISACRASQGSPPSR